MQYWGSSLFSPLFEELLSLWPRSACLTVIFAASLWKFAQWDSLNQKWSSVCKQRYNIEWLWWDTTGPSAVEAVGDRYMVWIWSLPSFIYSRPSGEHCPGLVSYTFLTKHDHHLQPIHILNKHFYGEPDNIFHTFKFCRALTVITWFVKTLIHKSMAVC